MMRESETDSVNGGSVKWVLACDGADAVGSKELLHELLISVDLVLVTCAVSEPSARRARMVVPGEASAAERRRVPSAL
jgi:hypothetical protein